jgi:hypothetical protein
MCVFPRGIALEPPVSLLVADVTPGGSVPWDDSGLVMFAQITNPKQKRKSFDILWLNLIVSI